MLLMQVFLRIKKLDCQRGSDLLLLAHCKSKFLLLYGYSAKEFIEKNCGLLKLGERVLRIEYRKNTSWVCGLCGHLKYDIDFLRFSYKMTEKGCRKCYVPDMDYVNDGTGDIGSAPSYLVLVRGLDSLTKQETVIKDIFSDILDIQLF